MFKKKNTQVFLSSFETHALKLQRLLGLSQQAEKKKKKPSFLGRKEPGRRWKDLSLWQISPISPGSGPRCRDTRRENHI